MPRNKKVTPETAIKKQIKDYLGYRGWFVFYCLQGLGAYKGIPDLIAVKDGRVVFLEVKRKNGKQSENQLKFESDINRHKGEYILTRGVDDLIERGF